MPVRKPSSIADLPEGFSYWPGFITSAEELQLLELFGTLQFKAFNFQGYMAKRRIIAYGFDYDFNSRSTSATQPIPDFLEPFRQRAAEWADLQPDDIAEAIITEYKEGSPIGWHRDVQQFETILGISLGSSCWMRFKPYRKEGKITSTILEPRSIYAMHGPARWNYQHSIPAVKSLRYSITFRTLRASRAQ
ncbi:MAG TPA: alpha-ketoglutarate-dependent dioxygenase AlkB [Candidatus Angelobacter sp.]|jgi:alkylated DNA repair dioxygenase AlkB